MSTEFIHLFQGCLEVKRDEDWYIPLRFTKKQLESYSLTEGLKIRSLSPAGCKLAFYTSATNLQMEYRIGGRASTWANFDVWEDGMLKYTVPVTEDSGQVSFELSGNEKLKVEIFLPHLVQVALRNIEADRTLVPAVREEKFWLCLGDSITQGMDAVRPSASYPVLVAKFLGCDVLNTGVGGGVFRADNLDNIGREPDLITIALGCNDWGHAKDAAVLRQSISEYLDKLTKLYSCRNIYGILPIWRSDADTVRSGMTFSEMRTLITEEYKKYPFIKILDGMKMVPALKSFYGAEGELKAHPNEEGFLHYALGLVKEIKI